MAPTKCNYRDCTNTNLRKSIFSFPINDEPRLKLWLRHSGNAKLASLTHRELMSRFICEDHFEALDVLKQPLRSRLVPTAVPLMYVPVTTQCLDMSSPESLEVKIPQKVQKTPEASTSIGACDRRNLITESFNYTPQIFNSDEEPPEMDAEESEQVFHYTTSKETQKGQLRLRTGAGSSVSLLLETAEHSLQQELLMDLHEISDRIQSFYPTALGKQFTLTFKGEDGDKSEYVFTSASETRRSGEMHIGLTCDECGSDIAGFRYKCVSCAAYDLCSACEALGTHAHHLMMRIAKPIKLKQARSLLQHWCDVMKTAEFGTTEEITGSGSTDSDPSPAVTVTSAIKDPVNVSLIKKGEIIKGATNIKTKVIKSKTPKGRPKTWKNANTQPLKKSVGMKNKKTEDPEKDSEAKKRKIISSERESAIDMLPIKEEPLENTDLVDFYSSFAETEPAVQVEDVKVEYPDPLAMDDMVKTEEIEESSLTAPGLMEANASSEPATPSQWSATRIKTYTHKATRVEQEKKKLSTDSNDQEDGTKNAEEHEELSSTSIVDYNVPGSSSQELGNNTLLENNVQSSTTNPDDTNKNTIQEGELSKKRKREPVSWQRNVLKKRREAGEEYCNIKGKHFSAKKVKPGCEVNCVYRCSRKFTPQEREELKTSFYSLDDRQKYTFYNDFTSRVNKNRKRTDAEESRRKYSFKYFFLKNDRKERVCKTFFCGTLDISARRIYYFHEKHKKGTLKTVPTPSKGKYVKKTIAADKIDEVIKHIKCFPTQVSPFCRANTKHEYLDKNLSITKMHSLYVESYKEPVKEHIYRKVFNERFNLAFHRPRKHACDACWKARKHPSTEQKAKYEEHERKEEGLEEREDSSSLSSTRQHFT